MKNANDFSIKDVNQVSSIASLRVFDVIEMAFGAIYLKKNWKYFGKIKSIESCVSSVWTFQLKFKSASPLKIVSYLPRVP